MNDFIPVRLAHLDDAAAVAPLLEQLGYPSTPDDVRQRLYWALRDSHYAAWVAELAGTVVGFAGASIGHYFEKNGRYGRLLVLIVDEAARGTGAGTALIHTAEAWIAAEGGIHVVVNSGNHRVDAHTFYEHNGYAATGLRFMKALAPGG